MATISKLIKDVRKAKGLTQEALAFSLGYKSRSAIAKIESGEKEMSSKKLLLFMKKYNLSMEDLAPKKRIVRKPNNDVKKKLVLLDMDGTVYLGDTLFECVPRVFDFLNEKNIDFVFLTNNSSHSIEHYVNKMNRLGVLCDRSNFYTSTETTIKYLRDHGFRRVYVLGVSSFRDKLEKEFEVVESYDVNRPVEAVVAAFDTELKYSELSAACLYIQKGAAFIATNMDYRCPIEGGLYIPDCGGMCKWIEMCTGVAPKFLGKPAPEMIYQVEEIFKVKPEEVIMVGDRHYTDIMAGNNAGVDTVGVLTGETSKEEFENAEFPPTYIVNSIESLIDILK